MDIPSRGCCWTERAEDLSTLEDGSIKNMSLANMN